MLSYTNTDHCHNPDCDTAIYDDDELAAVIDRRLDEAKDLIRRSKRSADPIPMITKAQDVMTSVVDDFAHVDVEAGRFARVQAIVDDAAETWGMPV